MKKIMIGMLLIISTSVINAQEVNSENEIRNEKEKKTITYEEMKTITKGAFEVITCDIYIAKDGHSYKIGDTLKIGRPSSNKTFAFITEGNALATPQPLLANSSGTNSIIKKITVGGNKRAGFKIVIVGKGFCALCPQYYIDFEEAITTGEIQSFGMTREQAIAKLKEAKDLVDLGIMTKEDFEKLKEELSKIIMQKQ
jgi:hypothetical protein